MSDSDPSGAMAFDPRAIGQLAEDIGSEATAAVFAHFTQETLTRLARMRELVPRPDRTEIGREAHSLKGTARTFGFMRLAALAQEIEAAADGGSASASVSLAAIDRLAEAYQAAYAATPAALRDAA